MMRRAGLIWVGILLACGEDGTAATAETSTSDTGSTGAPDSTGGSSSSASSEDTGSTDPLVPDPGESRYAYVGEQVVLDGSASTGAVQYTWNPDDGSDSSGPSSDPTLNVTYDTPGRYSPVLTVYDGQGNQLSASITITVTEVPTHVPHQSSTIAHHPEDERVVVVSPDSDEITIIRRNGDAFEVEQRLPTCNHPRTVVWWGDRPVVACQSADAVHVLDPSGGPGDTVSVPRGARPFGVVATGDRVWVTLQSTGRLGEIDMTGPVPVLVGEVEAITDARGIAVLPDGTLAVSRWRSSPNHAEVAIVDPGEGTTEVVTLQFDPQEAGDTEGGGVPSYLDQLLVSPIGDRIAIPSLQANVGQGEYLDGKPLKFDQTLRGIVSYVDLPDAVERFEQRKHFDNRGFMSAGVFSSRGDYLFLAARGARAIERVDTFSGGQSGSLLDVGYAPSGVTLSPDDRYLYVDAFMSREVVIYDVTDFSVLPQPVAALAIPSIEPLSPQLLRGKQLFNDSFDVRLAKDAYIACAHCHLDGESDRQTWDFTDRGEGLRNTISLLGRGGNDHGPIHWSANFDEVQDFEHDIRGPFGGLGLMTDDAFHTGTRDETLGDPKAGVSEDLDALAAYVESLTTYPKSPHRSPDGSLTADAQAGEILFQSPALGCTNCHNGGNLTDSSFTAPAQPLLHDVGTLGPGSGQRLGESLTGLDTPTLHALWNAPPYLHDGSAATLQEVLTTRNPTDLHGTTSALTPAEIDQLVAYLLSLEG